MFTPALGGSSAGWHKNYRVWTAIWSYRLQKVEIFAGLPPDLIWETNGFSFIRTASYVGFNKHINVITHQSGNIVYWTTGTIKVARPSFKHLKLLFMLLVPFSCSVFVLLVFLPSVLLFVFFGEGCIIFKSPLWFFVPPKQFVFLFQWLFGVFFMCESALNPKPHKQDMNTVFVTLTNWMRMKVEICAFHPSSTKSDIES